MKRASVIIAASLAVNAVLIGYVLLGRTTAPQPPSTPAAGTVAITSAGPTSASAATDFATALRNQDHAALRDLLRAAGFPDDMVREIVQSRIWRNLHARIQEIQPDRRGEKTAWWLQEDNQDEDVSPAVLKAQRTRIQELQRAAEEESVRLLGDDPDEGSFADDKLAFLPREKRLHIQKIEQDYGELMSEVYEESRDFRTPSDTAKLRLLTEERLKDIMAVMSPDEQKAYDLRASGTAENLRWNMTKLKASEAEYLAIFAKQKAFDEKYARNDPFGMNDDDDTRRTWTYEEREAEEKKLKQEIRTLIGEERYQRSLKEQDNDWNQLQGAARRFALPSEVPERIYALRETVADTARKIVDNPALSADTKKQALVDLAAQTRKQVRAGLGEEVADAYFKNSGMNWLKTLEDGHAVTFSRDETNWEHYTPAEPAKNVPIIRIEE